MSREQVITKINDITGFPVSTGKLINILMDPNVNISEILKTVEYDPGITANILKLANSALYSSGREISSLKDAMVRIGNKSIIKIMLTSSMSSIMKVPIKGYDLPPGELWQSSVSTAISTEVIAEALNMKVQSSAFTAGLLHDIGKIIMSSFVNINAAEITSYAHDNRIPFNEAERAIVGIDHAEAGAILMEKWKLPDELIEPVKYHHSPGEAKKFPLITQIVHIADALTMMGGLGAGKEGLNYKLDSSIVEKLGLSIGIVESIMCKTKCRYDDLTDIFSL